MGTEAATATGAQVLVAALDAAGVEVVFGLPGVHTLAAWEALRESPIRLIGVRHEQAAAYAADGYARATGRLGVALVTTGPGAANTLGAVGEAWAGGAPVLVVATDIPGKLRRPGVYRGVLHECTDQRAMFAPVTKAQFAGPDPRAAIAAALAHPRRPVYLEIATDALSQPAAPQGEPEPDGAAPEARDLDRAIALLDGARRPLVWAGGDAVRVAARERLTREQPDELAFLAAFARAVPPEAIVVCDMCIPGYWIGAFHPFAAPRRLVYPLGWGTLGAAFPQALGASLAGPGPVVSISGDGGFLFACGELATMAQERLPFTAVIVNDGGYGMLRFDQRRHEREAYGVDLHTPDFVALAQAFGVRAERVEGLTDAFADALATHLADPEPSVLVASAALEPPPTTSPRWYRPA